MRRTMDVIVALFGLIAIAVVVTPLIRRRQRSIAIEEALARGVEPGMRLEEATALLERLEMPYTVHTTPEGNVVVRYRREETHDRRVSRFSEEQLVFDRAGQLRDMLAAARISSP
jgi:hypothetical protein